MVESTSFIQSSHPDKYNNSVDRIISKEEEREDPRRDSSIYLRVQWCFHKYYKNYKISSNTVYSTVFPHAIQQLQVILHTELILLQEILQLQGSSRVIPCRSVQGIFQQLLPCLQALHTADSSYKAPYSIPGPYSTSRLPVILPGRNSILHGSQHSRSPYSNSQASSTVTLQNSTRRNRILSKGLSIVYPIQY